MQIKITRPIYIRKGPGRSHDFLAPIFPSGKGIEVDGVEKGESWKGINDWYFKFNEKGEKQWYWAGGVQLSAAVAPPSIKEIVYPPRPFNWNKLFFNIGQLAATRGANIIVAVLDDGLETNHDDFTGAFNTVKDTTGSTAPGLNLHGTEVAGIIGARNSNNKGITGVAPDCRIIPIRISRPNDFKPEYAVKAIKQAVELGADIINISMSLDTSAELDKIITDTVNAGIPIVVSAGDQDEIMDPLRFPANNSSCITVASCTTDELVRIKATIPSTIHFVGGHVARFVCSNAEHKFYMKDIGSSFSCAYISGLLALLFSQLKKQGEDIKKLDRAAIINKLLPFVTPFDNPDFMDDSGFGFDIVSRIKTI